MQMQELNIEQRTKVFNNHLSTDFHAEEVKSFQMIENLILQNRYSCYGFFENKEQKGYAYFTKAEGGEVILLDYLVVYEENRDKGYGSEFLELMKDKLKTQYKYLLAEVEDAEFSLSGEDKILRERRIAFYRRNSFQETSIKSNILSENYIIFALPLSEKCIGEDAIHELNRIYTAVFGETFMKENAKVVQGN